MTHMRRLLVLLPLACMVGVGHLFAQSQAEPASRMAVDAARESDRPPTLGSRADAARATPASLAARPQYLSDVAAASRASGAGGTGSEPFPLAAALPQDSITPWPWGWMARGVAGGLVAGPIGAAVAYNMIGRGEPGRALDERIRARRKEAVVVGGMLGTAVLAVFLLRVVDLDGVSQGEGRGPGQEPA